MTSAVRVSIGLGGFDVGAATEATLAAEDEGVDGIWLSDHLMAPTSSRTRFPYGAGGLHFDAGMPFPDTWVLAGHLAARTQRVRIGSGVFIAPLRHPFVLARAAATAQLASGNRVVVGVGAGWLEEEFDAVGIDFGSRGAHLDACLEICGELWTGEAVARDGPHFRFDEVQLVPAPEVPPPVVVGGHSPAALRRAARVDGWYSPAVTVAEAVVARETINADRAAGGRNGTFDHVIRPAAPIDRAEVRRLRAEGFDHLSAPLSVLEGPRTDLAAAVRELAGRLRGE